jgi:hypothetical protein
MSSQTVLKGLRRAWKSVPLPTLNQGASLSIRSRVPIASLKIVSQWRDDGHVDLEQTFPSDDIDRKEVGMFISQQTDQMTSLGRPATHFAIELREEDDTVATTAEASSRAPPEFPPNLESKPTTQITGDRESEVPGVTLSVLVPEKVNIDVNLERGGHVLIPDKIEGDVRLSTSDGSIKVKKLRGHEIHLQSMGVGALIHVSSVLEAQKLTLSTSGRVRAKQLHAGSMNVQIAHSAASEKDFEALEDDDEVSLIDVSSLFVSGQGGATLAIRSVVPRRKAVRVKSSHGSLRVLVEEVGQPTERNPMTGEIYPLVELGGVNGSFELSTEGTTTADVTDWTSCMCHIDSLSPDSVSLLTADVGNVALTVSPVIPENLCPLFGHVDMSASCTPLPTTQFDRKVESDVRLLSTSAKDCLVEAGALLAEEEDLALALAVVRNIPLSPDSSDQSSAPKIDVMTNTFTERPEGSYQSSHIHFVDGWVDDNSSEPPSRFDRKVRGDTGGSVGKIRLESAEDQALRGFRETSDEEGDVDFPRPLVAVVGTGAIKIETVSWLGAIARRYGLDESGRDLGRTASRTGRTLQPPTPTE